MMNSASHRDGSFPRVCACPPPNTLNRGTHGATIVVRAQAANGRHRAPVYKDVAISFAGEDRARAEDLANALRKMSVRVFYDADEKAQLWGKDLYADLTELYRNRAQF